MPRRIRGKTLLAILAALSPLALDCGGDDNSTDNRANQHDLSGHVCFIGTTQPLSGAVVSCADRTDTTLADGVFELPGLPDGEHTLSCLCADYLPFTIDLEITRDTSVAIELTPTSSMSLSGRVTHRFEGVIANATVCLQQICDVTDVDGNYDLSPVPSGSQTVVFSHPDYHTDSAEVDIYLSETTCDVYLMKTFHDSIWVENDAFVAYSEQCDGLQNDLNYGADSLLLLSHGLPAISGDCPPGDIYWTRVFLGLPPLPPSYPAAQLESCELLLPLSSEPPADAFFVFSKRVLESWQEDSITYDDQPDVDAVFLDVPCQIRNSGDLTYAVLDLFSLYQAGAGIENGIRLSLWADEFGEPVVPGSLEGYSFYSSESNRRPFVWVSRIY
ncbi:MAG: hypothetical protein KAW91_07185 [candidate division Zixibacteria bacterium]|nr:hypothetical protein [candidate division Zixibacteria bacterium]